MKSIWMAIAPGTEHTRVLVTRGPNEVILKAYLSNTPSSPHALSHFLEALALWEGCQVRAALVVDEVPMTIRSDEFFGFPPRDETLLYSLVSVWRETLHVRDELATMGDFEDLRALLTAVVAR